MISYHWRNKIWRRTRFHMMSWKDWKLLLSRPSTRAKFQKSKKISNHEPQNTKLKAQNTNLDSPQIFLKAFHDETPPFSPLDWVLEIFKQKWNIKRKQMRVCTKYQRGVTTRQWGMKGQTSGCLNDYLLETDKFQKQLPRKGRSEL